MLVKFFVVGMLLGDAVWCFLCVRRLVRTRSPGMIPICLFSVALALALMLIVFQWGAWTGARALLTTPVLACLYLWHFLFIIPMLLLWLPFAVAKGIAQVVRRAVGRKRAPISEPPGGLSRRGFLNALGWSAPAIFTVAATGLSLRQIERFRVRTMELPIPHLPPALDGLTIAHVADFHVGHFTHGVILEEIVERVNAMKADLVLSTGDLINLTLSDLPAGLAVMTRLRAEHGVFMCEGNHDLFENAAEFRRRTRAGGIRLLVNENAVVSIRGTPVQFLGLPWAHGDAATAALTQELLQQRRADAFPILLAHHPHAFDFAEGIPLTLAGHTHGGQLMVTGELGCGPMLFRYWSGLYRNGRRSLVVSNGVGNWFPLRTRAPAEIIHLTLRPA